MSISKLDFRPRPSVVTTTFDDESVLLDLSSGRYFSLNETGTRIWQLLCEEAGLDEIVSTLAAEYRVTADEVRNDAEELLMQLRAEGLVD